MPRPHPAPLALLALLGACYGPPDAPPTRSTGPAQTSEVVFQAVDAGTGSALLDDELTVRYLVRAPILLDDARVERVASSQPYRIAHEVSEDQLVVEVRLESASYHRLDTVLVVPRGGDVGPLTLRLARRLDRVAQGGGARPSGNGAATPPAATQPPSAGTSRPAVGAVVDLAAARAALTAGDRAFQQGNWLGAIQAYERLPAPPSRTGEYADQYQQALLKRGTAHINRGEFASALEVLDEATGFESASPQTYLRLSQAQCAVGRTEEGRGTLAQVSREVTRMPPAGRPVMNALIEYQRGLCSHGEFDRADTTRDRVRTGAAAIRELETFTQAAGAISPTPPELQAAVADAERRIEQIRGQIRG